MGRVIGRLRAHRGSLNVSAAATALDFHTSTSVPPGIRYKSLLKHAQVLGPLLHSTALVQLCASLEMDHCSRNTGSGVERNTTVSYLLRSYFYTSPQEPSADTVPLVDCTYCCCTRTTGSARYGVAMDFTNTSSTPSAALQPHFLMRSRDRF